MLSVVLFFSPFKFFSPTYCRISRPFSLNQTAYLLILRVIVRVVPVSPLVFSQTWPSAAVLLEFVHACDYPDSKRSLTASLQSELMSYRLSILSNLLAACVWEYLSHWQSWAGKYRHVFGFHFNFSYLSLRLSKGIILCAVMKQILTLLFQIKQYFLIPSFQFLCHLATDLPSDQVIDDIWHGHGDYMDYRSHRCPQGFSWHSGVRNDPQFSSS